VRGDEMPRRVVTVLLAEDDHAVRRVGARILRNAGFRVLEAGDGRSALALWRAHSGEIDVLVADVRMPQLRGDDLAAAVLVESPNFPVVLMTGFAEEPTAAGLAPDTRAPVAPSVRVLAKPFAAADLLGRIGEVLPSPKAGPGAGGTVLGSVGTG
jgi:CheY-like chemotaxis protein